jgi:hypothetical protein
MLRKIEWGVAILLTLLAVWLHYLFMRHGGALWRDETGALNLATMPHLPDVWAHLHYDSFPIFWVMVVRCWSAMGLGDDGGLRLLGFLTGISVLGALWFNAWSFKTSPPIISMLLLGFCPTIMIWGDSMRAWGWGVLWILLVLATMWRVVESPRVGNIVIAALAAIGSVQSIYYNAVLLFAICAGGVAVAFRRRAWKAGVAVLGIGFVSAISLSPYVGVIHRGAEEYIIIRGTFGVTQFVERITDAIRIPGTMSVGIWVLLVIGGMAAAIICQIRPEKFKATPNQRDVLLFSATTLVVAVAGYFVFLKNLGFITNAWYYAALLAVVAVTVETMLSVVRSRRGGAITRVAFACAVALMVLLPVWRTAHLRLTNADIVAQTLAKSAEKGDLIVVNPWYCGITFERYYSGPAAWMGLPDVKDYKIHRYDTIKEMITMKDPSDAIEPVRERMRETLKSGKRVWLVGAPIYFKLDNPPDKLVAAPSGPYGWYWGYYGAVWSKQAGKYIGSHAKELHKVELPDCGPVNETEAIRLMVAEGWRDN